MYFAIGGNNRSRAVQAQWTALHISHLAACLLRQQHACRNIPRVKDMLKRPIGAACRHVTEIQRGGAHTAHILCHHIHVKN